MNFNMRLARWTACSSFHGTFWLLTRSGWSSVMYVNPRTGVDVSGWVRSERLKATGTMGPKQ
jgi:hypothetical protein